MHCLNKIIIKKLNDKKKEKKEIVRNQIIELFRVMLVTFIMFDILKFFKKD